MATDRGADRFEALGIEVGEHDPAPSVGEPAGSTEPSPPAAPVDEATLPFEPEVHDRLLSGRELDDLDRVAVRILHVDAATATVRPARRLDGHATGR